jgi:hypothetical protein
MKDGKREAISKVLDVARELIEQHLDEHHGPHVHHVALGIGVMSGLPIEYVPEESVNYPTDPDYPPTRLSGTMEPEWCKHLVTHTENDKLVCSGCGAIGNDLSKSCGIEWPKVKNPGNKIKVGCEYCAYSTASGWPTRCLCRRYPPPDPREPGPDAKLSRWPIVHIQSWCGEFDPGEGFPFRW